MSMFNAFMPQVAALSETSSADTMSGLLKIATEFVTWVITSMGSFLTFITTHPIVLAPFVIAIAGAGIGFLMRIWRSV